MTDRNLIQAFKLSTTGTRPPICDLPMYALQVPKALIKDYQVQGEQVTVEIPHGAIVGTVMCGLEARVFLPDSIYGQTLQALFDQDLAQVLED